jgi:ABC-type transporter Mla subunit MlaD
MTETTRNLWVGLFVVIALGALAVLMVWFGETPSWLGRNEWTLRITGVAELRGIGEGSPVTLNGVEIGRVKGLDFEDRGRPDQGVVVITRIKNSYSVPRGATARIYGATLGIGTGHVAIVVEPGIRPDPLPRENASIPGEMKSIFGELITADMLSSLERTVHHIGDLTREWTPVGTSLNQLLEQRGVEAVEQPGAASKGITPNLSTVMERLDRLVANLNVVLGDEEVQVDVKAAAADLKDTTEELKEMVALWKAESQKFADNLNQGVDRTEEQLDHSFEKLNEVLEHLNDSASSFAQVANAMAEGEGTAGLLVRDERLYEAAVLALERFSEAMASLQRILGKIEEDGYVTVGKAPSGVLKEDYEIPAAASENR